MSSATSKKLTPAQVEERRARRTARREAVAARLRELKAWREDRRIAGQKRAAIKAKAAQKKAKGKRGVDRVPASIRNAPSVTVETLVEPELGVSTLPDGRKIKGPYAVRRAHGARGHKRRPRQRELTAYALAEMTKGERRVLDQELARWREAGKEPTSRQVREWAWAIMRDARFPKAPAQ